jgi:selenocysteine-specific elongation factor
VLALVRRFHEERPLVHGVSPKELETQLPPPARGLAGAAVERLVAKGALARDEGVVRDPARAGAEPSGLVRALEERFAAAALTPPLDEEARAAVRASPKELKDALAELKRRGRLARLGDLHFHTSALEELSARVRRHLASQPELSTADFKQLAGGVSRKYAIPLLEWLDGRGVTRRKGDVRVAGGR